MVPLVKIYWIGPFLTSIPFSFWHFLLVSLTSHFFLLFTSRTHTHTTLAIWKWHTHVSILVHTNVIYTNVSNSIGKERKTASFLGRGRRRTRYIREKRKPDCKEGNSIETLNRTRICWYRELRCLLSLSLLLSCPLFLSLFIRPIEAVIWYTTGLCVICCLSHSAICVYVSLRSIWRSIQRHLRCSQMHLSIFNSSIHLSHSLEMRTISLESLDFSHSLYLCMCVWVWVSGGVHFSSHRRPNDKTPASLSSSIVCVKIASVFADSCLHCRVVDFTSNSHMFHQIELNTRKNRFCGVLYLLQNDCIFDALSS